MRTPAPHVAKDGTVTYRVRFRHGRRNTSETFTDEDHATRFCRLLADLGAQGALDQLYAEEQRADVVTLDEYADTHIASLTNITDGTRNNYRNMYEANWSPSLGYLPVHQVTRAQIAGAVNAMTAADKTIANRHGLLAGIFNAAVLDGLIPASPCRGIRLPRRTEHEREDMVILDEPEFQILLAEIPPHYRPLVCFLIGTGARWGEAEALEVGDLDLRHKTVTIRRAAKWDGSRATREVGPTKTRRGKRRVVIPDQVVAMLADVIRGRGKHDRVFLAPRGGHLRHRTFWSDIWRPAIWRAQHCPTHRVAGCKCGSAHPERCKVHRSTVAPCGCDGTLQTTPRIHDLRHTHASTLLGAGVPIHVVQIRLGHESIQTTVDTYGHLLPDAQRAAADAASAMFGLSAATSHEQIELSR